MLNGNKCVLRIECGCKDTQGVLILVSGCGEWDAGAGGLGRGQCVKLEDSRHVLYR